MDERGFVEKHDYIFDIYTKQYDFHGCNVKVVSAHDLRNFYAKHHKEQKKEDIYTMADFFVDQHRNGHFIVDECPFQIVDFSSK